MENKKIKNATITEFQGITFRSKLEVTVYKALLEDASKDNSIKNIQYEPEKHVIWKGFKPTLPFYIRDKKTKKLTNATTKLVDITYTPDIVFEYGNNIVLVEVKPQFMNDVFPYKRKLFRKYLEDTYSKDSKVYPIYCQISTGKEMHELINILKENYGNSN